MSLRAGWKIISTRPKRGRCWPRGQTRAPPRIVTGSMGTSASSASRAAPTLKRANFASANARSPSGKIITAPPPRSHCKERRYAVGFPRSRTPAHALPGVAHTRDHAALLRVVLFRPLTTRPHAFERGDLQLLPPVGDVALRERVRRPTLATRALEARVRARLLLRQRQTRPRAARRVAAPALDLDQQHLPREHDSFGHAQLREGNDECGMMNDELKKTAWLSSFRIHHSAFITLHFYSSPSIGHSLSMNSRWSRGMPSGPVREVRTTAKTASPV